MIVLRTLGESLIEVGPERVGPGAPHLFGLLLYLAVERGRRESRSVLQALFFPESSDRNANHSLRQLAYKARQTGAPLDGRLGGLCLPADAIVDDYSALVAGLPDAVVDPVAIAGGFLPGYAPTFSAPFTEWLERQRARVHALLRRTLMATLQRHRQAGDWTAAEQVARACLALDPLNEDATLALAEVLALGGSRLDAVRLLDEYLREVGETEGELRRPAALLRRRISERLPRRLYVPEEPTFRGRAEQMAQLQMQLQVVRGGVSRSCLVWGEPGIGKTRLVTEFGRAAVLSGAAVQTVSFQPHDMRRPMAAFSDLVPPLRRLPGALGCSPEALGFLDRLVRMDTDPNAALSAEVRDAEYLSARITRAISELLDAVAAETTLVLVLEDVHWLDRLSLQVFDDLLAERKSRRLMLVLTSREMTVPPAAERAAVVHVEPLSEADAAALFTEQLLRQALSVDGDFLRWCLQIAAGNPFFVRELSRHYAATRETYKVPTTLTELLARRLTLVDAVALKALQGCAVLGRHATFERLERMLALSRVELLDAVQRLEEHGLLTSTGEQLVPGHALLADVVLKRATATVRKYLHRHAAEVLAPEMLTDLALGWACAEHWEGAGVPERSVEVLRSCARHAMEIGRPDEACTLLKRPETATRIREDPQLRELAVSAAELSHDWPLLLACLNGNRTAYSHSVDTSAEDVHHFLLRAEAISVTSGLSREAIDRILDIAHSGTSLAPQRLRAALLLTFAADENFDSHTARSALGIAQSLRRHDGDHLLYPKIALIYNISFGSTDKAQDIAEAIQRRQRHTTAYHARCGLLQCVTLAFMRSGALRMAHQAVDELLTLSHEQHVSGAVLAAHSLRTSLCLVEHKFAEAQANHERADAVYSQMGLVSNSSAHLSNAVELALHRREPDVAEELLTLANKILPRVRFGRARLAALGYRARILLLRSNSALPERLLSELREAHLLGRSFGLHDDVAESYFLGLCRAGKSQDAQILATEYVSRFRRDRFPVSPLLSELVSSEANRESTPDPPLPGITPSVGSPGRMAEESLADTRHQ